MWLNVIEGGLPGKTHLTALQIPKPLFYVVMNEHFGGTSNHKVESITHVLLCSLVYGEVLNC